MSSGSEHPADSDAGQPNARILQEINVRFEYPVIFCADMLARDQGDLHWALTRLRHGDERIRVYAIADAGFLAAWPDVGDRLTAYFQRHAASLELCGPLQHVPGGEAAKNDPALVSQLRDDFARARLDRHAVVLTFGGGAVLDAVGYAAATTHRGLRLVRAPTTVLAQNDAGIGVKNGVNTHGVKNFVGTFAPPAAVLCDHRWLTTSSIRDRRAGLAEAVKVALLRDTAFFRWMQRYASALAEQDPAAERHMIRRCAELHLDHIRSAGDPFESGSARPLDYGHWAAHKLERLTDHALRHGEAVAIGMALDACCAANIGWLAPSVAAEILALLTTLGLPIWHDALAEVDAQGHPIVYPGVEEFREHIGGPIDITLLTEIGACRSRHAMSVADVQAAIARLDVERRRRPTADLR